MPGTRPLRAGVSKISAWSCGAAIAGEESRSLSSLYLLRDFLAVDGLGVCSVRDLLRVGRRAVEWGVAWRRQFLSRTRWRRTSLAGVRRAVAWWAVEGGAKGEDWMSSEGLARGVDGRVDSDVSWFALRVSRFRVS